MSKQYNLSDKSLVVTKIKELGASKTSLSTRLVNLRRAVEAAQTNKNIENIPESQWYKIVCSVTTLKRDDRLDGTKTFTLEPDINGYDNPNPQFEISGINRTSGYFISNKTTVQLISAIQTAISGSASYSIDKNNSAFTTAFGINTSTDNWNRGGSLFQIGNECSVQFISSDSEVVTMTMQITAVYSGYVIATSVRYCKAGLGVDDRNMNLVIVNLPFKNSLDSLSIALYDGSVLKDSLTLTVINETVYNQYCGTFGSSTPTEFIPGDCFLCTTTFIESGKTYETGEAYIYDVNNGWIKMIEITSDTAGMLLLLAKDAVELGLTSVGVYQIIDKLIATDATIANLFSKQIKILQGGCVYGGAYNASGTNLNGKGFYLGANGELKCSEGNFESVDISGNTYIHGNSKVGGVIVNTIGDTEERTFYTNKDEANSMSFSTASDQSSLAFNWEEVKNVLKNYLVTNIVNAHSIINMTSGAYINGTSVKKICVGCPASSLISDSQTGVSASTSYGATARTRTYTVASMTSPFTMRIHGRGTGFESSNAIGLDPQCCKGFVRVSHTFASNNTAKDEYYYAGMRGYYESYDGVSFDVSFTVYAGDTITVSMGGANCSWYHDNPSAGKWTVASSYANDNSNVYLYSDNSLLGEIETFYGSGFYLCSQNRGLVNFYPTNSWIGANITLDSNTWVDSLSKKYYKLGNISYSSTRTKTITIFETTSTISINSVSYNYTKIISATINENSISFVLYNGSTYSYDRNSYVSSSSVSVSLSIPTTFLGAYSRSLMPINKDSQGSEIQSVIGSTTDPWGQGVFDTIYAKASGYYKSVLDVFLPIGSYLLHSLGSGLDTDVWKICDGSAISRTSYAELFAIIGTTYGSGNGSTTFNIPDFRGTFPVGSGGTGARARAGFGSHQEDAIRNITGQFNLRPCNDTAPWGAFILGSSMSSASYDDRTKPVIAFNANSDNRSYGNPMAGHANGNDIHPYNMEVGMFIRVK